VTAKVGSEQLLVYHSNACTGCSVPVDSLLADGRIPQAPDVRASQKTFPVFAALVEVGGKG